MVRHSGSAGIAERSRATSGGFASVRAAGSASGDADGSTFTAVRGGSGDAAGGTGASATDTGCAGTGGAND